ncbi:hypothetical protein ACWGN5_07760 [Streptomyces sp. NPDC055815]
MFTPMLAAPLAAETVLTTEEQAATVYIALRDAMAGAGLPADGLYRDVVTSSAGERSVYNLGFLDESSARRLTAILWAARRTA